MLTGVNDISYDVITLGTYVSMFFFTFVLLYALIGGNLTAQKYI